MIGRRWIGVMGVVAVLAGPVLQVPRAAADSTVDQRMLELINRERTANGLNPVVANPVLAAEAGDAPYLGCGFPVAGRATDMGVRNYFSHTILNCQNQSVFNLLNATTLLYSGAGENIAWVNAVTDPLVAADNLHAQLMASPGHRANILNPNFTSVGIGSWHTAPGQTWSGAGFPLGNVYIVTEIFAGLPLGLGSVLSPTSPTTAAPTTAAPTTAAPTTAAPTTAAPAPAQGGAYTPVTAARILDTRIGLGGSGPLGPGATLDMQVTGRAGVPASGVAAVALNITVTQPSAFGLLTLYPSGTARPSTSSINFGAGETVTNLAVAKLGTSGKVAVYNATGTSHVVADVAGWFSDGPAGSAGRFQPLVSSRILDTRVGIGALGRLGPGASLDVQVAGQGGVPLTGSEAAVLNVVVTGTSAPSYVTVFPAGQTRPDTANLTFGAGATRSNRVMANLGAGGKVTIFNAAGSADVIVDLNGWYTDGSAALSTGTYVALPPSRLVDSRDGTGGVNGMITGGTTTAVRLAGRAGVPASGARAVVLNVIVVGPAAAGYLTFFPPGVAQPATSDLNYAAGDTRANLVVAQVAADGTVELFTTASTQMVFDVAGWFG